MPDLNPEQFRTVYHGVYDPKMLPKIQKEGLRPMRLKEVYTSPDFKTAGFFGTKHVLEVQVHPSEIISESPGSVLSGAIPPERIVKVHERREGELWPEALKRDVPMPPRVRAALDKFKADNPGVIRD